MISDYIQKFEIYPVFVSGSEARILVETRSIGVMIEQGLDTEQAGLSAGLYVLEGLKSTKSLIQNCQIL
jgi:hypothetical protein